MIPERENMNKQPEITDKTRQRFVDVFCELYAKMPIEKISIQKLTKLAGYNRSTFYHYFEDIYELLEYVENDLLTYVRQSLEKRNINTPQHIYELFEAKELEVKALLGKYGNIRFLEKIKEEFNIKEVYTEMISDTSIMPYLLEFHISTSLTLFHLWLNREKDLPSEKLFSLIHDLYSKGVSAYIQ